MHSRAQQRRGDSLRRLAMQRNSYATQRRGDAGPGAAKRRNGRARSRLAKEVQGNAKRRNGKETLSEGMAEHRIARASAPDCSSHRELKNRWQHEGVQVEDNVPSAGSIPAPFATRKRKGSDSMPKLPKNLRPEPTKEEVFRETWAATNRIIRKAMIDRDVRHDKDLAEQIGLSRDLFSKRMTMKVPWSYQDLCLVVSALKIPGEDVAQMLGARR